MTPEDLSRFRAGESAFFRELVKRYSPRLLSVCRGFAADSDGAHDLVQETWIRVFSKRRGFHGGSFSAWLYVVCRRVCLSAVRKRGAVADQDLDVDMLPDPSPRPGPEELAIGAELRGSISRALLELPPRQREAVVCRLIEGLSTRETAAQMGCAEGTVKATLHQALDALADPLRTHSQPSQPLSLGAKR